MRRARIAAALLIAALAGAPLWAEPIDLPNIGLTIERPDNWRRASDQENDESVARVDFGADAARRLEESRGLSLIVLTRDSELPVQEHPTIKVGAHTRAQLGHLSPLALVNLLITDFRSNALEVQIEEGPMASRRFGFDGAYARLTYTLTVEGERRPTRGAIWVVPRGEIMFLIGLSMSAEESAATWAEGEAILETIRIAPPVA